MGPLTPHHIRKASQGGPWSLANIITLCARHNDWLEEADGARFGRRVGLVARREDDLPTCWTRLTSAGLVDYGPEEIP
jgi:hypothetical protein